MDLWIQQEQGKAVVIELVFAPSQSLSGDMGIRITWGFPFLGAGMGNDRLLCIHTGLVLVTALGAASATPEGSKSVGISPLSCF